MVHWNEIGQLVLAIALAVMVGSIGILLAHLLQKCFNLSKELTDILAIIFCFLAGIFGFYFGNHIFPILING